MQEVLAERETQIGLYYESRENYAAAIARLQTVVDTYPLYSKSDQALLAHWRRLRRRGARGADCARTSRRGARAAARRCTRTGRLRPMPR